MRSEYLVLTGMWVAWCAIHSAMISATVTDFLRHRLAGAFRYYRVIFNFVAIATLIPIIVYGRSLQAPILWRWDGLAVIVHFGLLGTGIALFVAGARHYDMLHFIGLRQIRTGVVHGALTASGRLQRDGILRVMRHPWYLAAILLVWTGDLTAATLVGKSILTVYVIAGTWLEERKLLLEFGEEYRRYQEQVSCLLPIRYIMSRR